MYEYYVTIILSHENILWIRITVINITNINMRILNLWLRILIRTGVVPSSFLPLIPHHHAACYSGDSSHEVRCCAASRTAPQRSWAPIQQEGRVCVHWRRRIWYARESAKGCGGTRLPLRTLLIYLRGGCVCDPSVSVQYLPEVSLNARWVTRIRNTGLIRLPSLIAQPSAMRTLFPQVNLRTAEGCPRRLSVETPSVETQQHSRLLHTYHPYIWHSIPVVIILK